MNTVISIGRQFGSGGRSVGQQLAERMGYKYYEKELIPLAAKEIGFDPSIFEKVDEVPRFLRFFQGLYSNGMDENYSHRNYMSRTMLFQVQSDVIRRLAEESSCVIVGRCSDYVLRDNPKMVSVFLSATTEDRIARICERTGEQDREKIEKLLRYTDRNRANYYNTYSGKEWGRADSYDLCINVSKIGIECTVDAIERFVVAQGIK